jgi:hypothetical protein
LSCIGNIFWFIYLNLINNPAAGPRRNNAAVPMFPHVDPHRRDLQDAQYFAVNLLPVRGLEVGGFA